MKLVKHLPLYLAFLAFLCSGTLLYNLNNLGISDWIATLIFPFLILILYPLNILMFKVYKTLTEKDFEHKTFIQTIVASLLLFVHITISLNMFGLEINVGMIVGVLIGVLMIVIGLMFPKTKRNALFGARTIWSLKDDKVWKLTNKFASKIFVYFGALLIILSLLFSQSLGLIIATMIAILVIVVLLIEVFSYKTYRRLYS